ncbi:MAG TPA: hypothetical protein VHT34_09235 [Clostridia bacterium]|nr:hypothetical protein [Clostridia bacterium]
MFFIREKTENNSDKKIADKIKKELAATFGKKGIKIKDINIDLQDDNMNIMVSINRN